MNGLPTPDNLIRWVARKLENAQFFGTNARKHFVIEILHQIYKSKDGQQNMSLSGLDQEDIYLLLCGLVGVPCSTKGLILCNSPVSTFAMYFTYGNIEYSVI